MDGYCSRRYWYFRALATAWRLIGVHSCSCRRDCCPIGASNCSSMQSDLHPIGGPHRNTLLFSQLLHLGPVRGLNCIELLQDSHQHETGLSQSELLAKANPRPSVERQELPCGDPLFESLRLELHRVFAPDYKREKISRHTANEGYLRGYLRSFLRCIK